MSTSQNNDNPYAAPLTVSMGNDTARVWGCFNTTILVLTAPMFLFCLVFPVLCWTLPVLFGVCDGWQYVRSLLFVVGFIGTCFHKEWAYGIVIVIAVIWAMISLEIADAIASNPEEEPPFPGLFILLFLGSALHSAAVALTGFVLVLSGLKSRYQNHKRLVLQNNDYD